MLQRNYIRDLMYREATNVEFDSLILLVGISQRNSTKRFTEKFGSHAKRTFDRFTTKDSYTGNITHNTESTAV